MLTTLKSINTRITFIICFKLQIFNIKLISLNYLPIILILEALES